MVHTLKLKAAMIENGYTNATLSKKIGIAEKTFSAKLNNKNYFTLPELISIRVALNLNTEKFEEIFMKG